MQVFGILESIAKHSVQATAEGAGKWVTAAPASHPATTSSGSPLDPLPRYPSCMPQREVSPVRQCRPSRHCRLLERIIRPRARGSASLLGGRALGSPERFDCLVYRRELGYQREPGAL